MARIRELPLHLIKAVLAFSKLGGEIAYFVWLIQLTREILRQVIGSKILSDNRFLSIHLLRLKLPLDIYDSCWR